MAILLNLVKPIIGLKTGRSSVLLWKPYVQIGTLDSDFIALMPINLLARENSIELCF